MPALQKSAKLATGLDARRYDIAYHFEGPLPAITIDNGAARYSAWGVLDFCRVGAPGGNQNAFRDAFSLRAASSERVPEHPVEKLRCNSKST